MSIWQLILLFSTVILGGSAGFYLQKSKKGLLQILLSFSGSYILGIAVLHLMPWVFSGQEHQPGLWILAGFFVQLLLEQFSAGVEHGHIHAPHQFSPSFMVSVMLGLGIHAFVEGMPLSYYPHFHPQPSGHAHEHNHLLYGIILHHIPAAFALVTLLLLSGLKKAWVWLCLVIFALMSPLGALLAAELHLGETLQKGILAFAVGSLLHISTVILFEMDNAGHHRISPSRLLAIATGLGAALLTIS